MNLFFTHETNITSHVRFVEARDHFRVKTIYGDGLIDYTRFDLISSLELLIVDREREV